MAGIDNNVINSLREHLKSLGTSGLVNLRLNDWWIDNTISDAIDELEKLVSDNVTPSALQKIGVMVLLQTSGLDKLLAERHIVNDSDLPAYEHDEAVKIVFGGKEVVVEPDQTPLVMTVIRKGYTTEPFSPYQTINS